MQMIVHSDGRRPTLLDMFNRPITTLLLQRMQSMSLRRYTATTPAILELVWVLGDEGSQVDREEYGRHQTVVRTSWVRLELATWNEKKLTTPEEPVHTRTLQLNRYPRHGMLLLRGMRRELQGTNRRPSGGKLVEMGVCVVG